jgi:predicted amidohydrolase
LYKIIHKGGARLKNDITIAICQMKVVDNKQENLKKARKMVMEAGGHADLVILPEMFNCPYDVNKFPAYAENQNNSSTLNMASEVARIANVYLCAGSIPELDGDKVYNSSFFFSPEGKILARHRKLHLFDIDVPGEITFKESETISPGNVITVIETGLGNIGIGICYDIRFPELFRIMTQEGAELILLPGAFNLTTGPAHWETIIRTRAIDNQVFLAAASPALNKDATYAAYGHSMVVDPWGNILVQTNYDEKIIFAKLDLDQIKKIRMELPLLKNRRNDLY